MGGKSPHGSWPEPSMCTCSLLPLTMALLDLQALPQNALSLLSPHQHSTGWGWNIRAPFLVWSAQSEGPAAPNTSSGGVDREKDALTKEVVQL